MFRLLAILKRNGTTIGFKIRDKNGLVRDCDIELAKRVISMGCENAIIDINGNISGTECSMNSIPVIDVDRNIVTSDKKFSILNVYTEYNKRVGYRVIDAFGEIKDLHKSVVGQLGLDGKISNARIENDNGKVIIRGIKREIKQIEKPKREQSNNNSIIKNKNEVPKVENKLERMKELVQYLAKCAYAYEQENREIISNYEYDKLYDELLQLEKETGITLAGSVTQKVGYEVSSKLNKIEHKSKMLSLDKTKEVSRLREFLGNNVGTLSWKLDGLTVVVTYEDGELVSAVTRGNGTVGEDITANYKTFSNVPLKINHRDKLVIRGEALITYSQFEEINSKLSAEEQYKNPRNLCSGSVRQLDPKITKSRRVKFIPFGVVDGLDGINSKAEKLRQLDKLGFNTVDFIIVNSSNLDRAINIFADNIEKSDFPSDGLVLALDDIEYSESLGSTSKFPKDAIAFKWQDEIKETTLLDIEWSTSRTGAINPIAIVKPVELEGTTVERASLHNVSIMEELELGIGDTVTIYKANMIIPQIADNLTRSGNVEIPDVCPVCGHPTEVVQEKTARVLMCTNLNCKAQLVRLLSHFVSRDAMNIDGLSEATLERFIEEGFIENLSDIYNLDMYANEIVNLPGFGIKSYEKLIAAIEKSKLVGKENFIYALGIPNVGLNTAKLILKHYNGDLLQAIQADYYDLVTVDGLGDVKARDFTDYMQDSDKLDILANLLEHLEFKADAVVNTDSNIAGMTFVVTGDVNHYKNRKELSAHIESLGGKVSGSVSKKTDYLINNDVHSTSSKNIKANELGIPIISEEEFMAMI